MNQDSLTIRLLELIDEYESTANGHFRLNFIDGYLNLSRANFNTGGVRTYGVGDFDLRHNRACKTITGKDKFELVDLLKNKLLKEKSGKEKNQQGEKSDNREQQIKHRSGRTVEPEKSDKETGKSENERETPDKDKEVKLKSQVTNKDIDGTEMMEFDNIKDPINQFGGLVPYQLRQAQNSFDKCIYDCIKLVNLQREINHIISQLQ